MKKKLIAAVLAAGLVLTGFQSDFLYGNVTAQAAENAGTVIDVTDFGADPSGKETVLRLWSQLWKRQRKLTGK